MMQNQIGKKTKRILVLGAVLFACFFSNNKTQAAFGFEYQGVGFYSYYSGINGAAPVYRFINPRLGAYFFTSSIIEKNDVLQNGYGFEYQGVAFYAFDYNKSGTSPVYRFANSRLGIYFYTTSTIERDQLMNDKGFEYQGVAFYAYNYDKSGTGAVYRFANRNTGYYFFTSSIVEKNQLMIDEYGPEISVGIFYKSRTDAKEDSFEIEANKSYNIKDKNGNIIASGISGSSVTKVKYYDDGHLRVYNSIGEKTPDREVTLEPADGDVTNMIFDVHRPGSSLDQYRGKVKVRYSSTSGNVWMINILPLELYVWGDGELAGTGDMDHNRVLVTSYRTYGYWKILYSTKYATEGFKVDATPGNQLYYGYDYEKNHTRIRQAAQDTRGHIIKYGNEVAITPYSSYTDGRTRSWEEKWGSKNYPWCRSVDDPWGKHPTKDTTTLMNEGNHMVGLSAHGSLELAENHGWSWDKIIHYYFHDVDISRVY